MAAMSQILKEIRPDGSKLSKTLEGIQESKTDRLFRRIWSHWNSRLNYSSKQDFNTQKIKETERDRNKPVTYKKFYGEKKKSHFTMYSSALKSIHRHNSVNIEHWLKQILRQLYHEKRIGNTHVDNGSE